ncbi:hypothetical protein [Lactobacillus terrae]|uniref:hypothetical protein n=1 Tax=Lactobacillus terrae TaxID=2269374 RepID=UPI000C1B6B85|nr:hypothetical protein [Lactobacillus terrae]
MFELFRIKITVESLLNSITLGVSFINLLFAFFVYNELIHNKQIYQVLSKNFKSIAIIFILTTKFIPRIVNVINNSRFMLKFNEQKKDSESKFNIFKKNIELIGTVFDKVIPSFMNMSDTLIIRGYTSNNINKSKKSKKNLDDIILRSLIGFEMLLSILFVEKKYGKVDFGSANIKITFNSYILVILIINILIVLIPIIMGGVHLLWWKLHHSETIRSDTQITSLYR